MFGRRVLLLRTTELRISELVYGEWGLCAANFEWSGGVLEL